MSCCLQIQEQNPELARESHVTRLTLDKVYDFALAPKENTPAEGVIFRFMPDASQVRHALQVLAAAATGNYACSKRLLWQASSICDLVHLQGTCAASLV